MKKINVLILQLLLEGVLRKQKEERDQLESLKLHSLEQGKYKNSSIERSYPKPKHQKKQQLHPQAKNPRFWR